VSFFKAIVQLNQQLHLCCTNIQAFMAGANAIFTGERMLTTPCSGWDEDKAMLGRWGLRGLRSFEDQEGVAIDPKDVERIEKGHVCPNAPASEPAAAA
jgi:hypothetical protein